MNRAILVAAIFLGILLVSSVAFIALKSGYFEELKESISPEPKPELYMQVQSSLETWFRDTNDRPIAKYLLNIEVGNTGNAGSDWADVYYSIEKNDYVIQDGVMPIGVILEGGVKDTSRQFGLRDGDYETSLELRTSTTVWDAFADSFMVSFPRGGSGDFVRFYITPNDPNVQSQLDTIGKDVNSLYGWVGDNIHYEYDSDVYGTGEYWQFPHETLNLRTGDCEDQAFLLCSLIRASGISVDNVFVALGKVDGEGHAWVILKTTSGWRVLEPTVEGIIDRFLTDLLGEFFVDRDYKFASNDLYYEEISPSNNRPYVSQSFEGWYESGLKLQGSRVTIELNDSVVLKIRVTNPGHYKFIGFIKIEIKKDIVLGTDIVFTTRRDSVTLEAADSQEFGLTFTPDEVTQNTIWKCRHYYYKVYTCFACIYDPADADTRECVFVSS